MRASSAQRTVVIGAGIGGLAAAVRLAHAGHEVLVLEKETLPGGKLRTLPSAAGPVDAGPTVFTLKPYFEALFRDVGERLEDHLDLIAEPTLARHWWPDGSTLELTNDPAANARAVREFGGAQAERDFEAFSTTARRLFEAFEAPVMQSAAPDLGAIVWRSATRPRLMADLVPPRTLWGALDRQVRDPRLRQLFARYTTYVGGAPMASPSLLSLIWHAESLGIWRVLGGMMKIAHALATLAERLGAVFRYRNGVTRIRRQRGGALRVHCADGAQIHADNVVFNGDPAALHTGALGPDMQCAVPLSATNPRSLSAYVWTFASQPQGVDLAHHNVFFNADYRREFADAAAGQRPTDAALYVCAQDRGHGAAPKGAERFQIIVNAAPVRPGSTPPEGEFEECREMTFATLVRMGLRFAEWPGRPALTTPTDFAALFPGSAGSLYGRSPHGMMASFRRPSTRTAVPGLYLAGGGVHPGAGLPMALTSGRHAAAAILKDLASTSTSRRTVMRGGMSMAFPTTAPGVSRSSDS